MHRYRSAAGCLLASTLVLAACSVPSPRDNVEAASELVRPRTGAALEWRRDPAADAKARARAAELLDGDLTLEAAVAVAFLVNPSLQVALEQLAISRSQLVAAVTPPNPVGVIGSRKPGGDLAAFYPERAISIGVLLNVIQLVNMPDRVAIAKLDLERARYATAQLAAAHAAEVVQAWLEYSAALQTLQQYQGDAGSSALTAESISAELVAATTRARLGELMGVTGWRDDWKTSVRLPPAPASDPDVVAVEAAALKQRLDLQASAKAVDVRLRTLAMQRRFRWLNQLDAGLFRDKALGGTSFTGPNAVVEIPLFDQRVAQLLQADGELHAAVRQLESEQIAARTQIRVHVAELKAMRQQLQLLEGASVPDASRIAVLLEYWRARSALAFASGDWAAISGL
jgi:cobalt-zinc-cadmium efflux system outer membrane protein